jgi:hypothetical protein
MKRRGAIKRISLAFGSLSLSSGIITTIQSCQTNEFNQQFSFFNNMHLGFLERVMEIIIPETETPGSKSLNIINFVDAHVAKNIRTEDQKYLVAMIDSFIEMILQSESKKSINLIDDSVLEKHFSNHIDNYSMISNNGQNYSEICGLIREMAVTSYKLTEYVMTNKLGFVPIPGYYDGSLDV